MLEMIVQVQPPAPGQAMTLAEFSRLPHDGRKYELLGGHLIMTPAGMEHEEIGSNLLYLLKKQLEPQAIGRVYGSSTGYRSAEELVLSPDVSFVRTEQE